MKRPWQVWLLYFAGLAGVMGAFAWLTVKAVELDRAESLARQQAELEEDVSRALWRIDALLTPLLAEEAARPEFVYRAIYPSDANLIGPAAKGGQTGTMRRVLSPLLVDPPQFTLVHFELHPDGQVFSPQCPTGSDGTWAVENGASPVTIGCASDRLDELRPALTHQTLLAQLPAQPLPTELESNPLADVTQMNNSAYIANSYDNVAQQLAVPNAPPAEGMQQQVAASGLPADQGLSNSVESGRTQRSQSRVGNDLSNRDAALQSYTQRVVAEKRSNLVKGGTPPGIDSPPPLRVVEGVSRPLWVGDRLLLARRVQTGDRTIVQGCWLDWPRLRQRLLDEVADLLPAAGLTPVSAAEPIKLSRLLATLPVQLSVKVPEPPPVGWTPIRVSLAIAWMCLLVTALTAAFTLHGVVALSERRGAFVSAVTHELRTPLTTFRMYAEMLAEGMVTSSQQRQRYLQTLRIEADRLAHLVENVLQYARLERGRPGQRREEVSLGELVDHCQHRLAERAAQAEMQLVVEIDEETRGTTLATDAAAVEQIVFNLVDNASKYAAQASDKRIHLALAAQPKWVTIAVRDHGPGISRAGRKKLFRPFSKSVHEAASTAPGVGLGLALSKRLAAELGGKLELESPAGGGAAFVLTLPR
jgi:signal transduction histidine kinase